SVSISRNKLLALYQAGRFITYTLLGIAAGLLGSGLDLTGKHFGLQQTAAVAAGALMVGFGTLTLLRIAGLKIKALALPTAFTTIVTSTHSRAMRYSAPIRALATG